VDYLSPIPANPYSFAQPPVCVDPGTPGSWGEMTRCNTLTGVFTIVNEAGDQFGANNMTAFKNYHTARPLLVGQENLLGYDSYNTLGVSAAVVAKNFVAEYLAYDPAGGGQTLHSFLAPTWLPRTDGQGLNVPPYCPDIGDKDWPMGPFFRTAMFGDCFCNNSVLCNALVPSRTSINTWQDAWDLKEGPALIISPPPDHGLLILLAELTNVVPGGPVWPGDIGFAAGVIPYVEGWARYGFVPALVGDTVAGTTAVDYEQWLVQAPACEMLGELPLHIVGAPLIASVLQFQSNGGVAVYNGAYGPGVVNVMGVEYPNYPLTQGGPNPIVP
jgi:hypothetical protein